MSHTPFHPETMPIIDEVVRELSSPASMEMVFHKPLHDAPMPSLESMKEIMSRFKAAIFPGYFGASHVRGESVRYHLSANLDSIYRLLAEQIRRGGCFACAAFAQDCELCDEASHERALAVVKKLPFIRHMLASDAKAAYEGDPAARSPGEAIFCYPSILAMTHHRIAHELYKLKVPIIPRIMGEMAHSHTGIDIHPGAQIGEEFFIDHGTGVVIGETCIIGNSCRLYQGVTLGALSFPKDESGLPVKGNPRHPILEDNVTVYAGATILGRVTIGQGSVIGGNVWVTQDVEPGARLVQRNAGS